MMNLQTSSGRQRMPVTLALALAALCMAGAFTASPAEARQNKWNNWGGHGHRGHYNDGYYNGGYNGGFYYYPQPYVQYAPPPVYYAPPPPVYYQPPPLFSVIIPLRID